jgi:hypothetical protein
MIVNQKKSTNMERKKKITELKNNTILNPQQIEFIKFYLDPNSETFGNATQSALKAKYTDIYAKNITGLMPKWLSENIGDDAMLSKAVSNLNEFLNMECKEDKIGAFGPIIDPITKKRIKEDNVGKMRIKYDSTKFVAERLGKKKWGQEGAKTIVPIQFNINSDKEEFA